jgi:hypothetical protein
VYDGTHDEAYWLYIQRYFERERRIDLATVPGHVTVHLPKTNRLDQQALEQFAEFRNEVLAQIEGTIRHG